MNKKALTKKERKVLRDALRLVISLPGHRVADLLSEKEFEVLEDILNKLPDER